MDSKRRRQRESIRTSLVFLKRMKRRPPRVVVLHHELAEIDARIERNAGTQAYTATVRGLPNAMAHSACEELRIRHLIPICRQGVHLLRGLPGIREALRIPHNSASAEEHLAAVKRVSDAVRPHVAAFHQAKYSRGFLTQLQRAAKKLERASANPGSNRARLSILTREIAADVRAGRGTIARLDAVIKAEFHDDPELLADWARHKRIPARIGRPRKRGRKPSAQSHPSAVQ